MLNRLILTGVEHCKNVEDKTRVRILNFLVLFFLAIVLMVSACSFFLRGEFGFFLGLNLFLGVSVLVSNYFGRILTARFLATFALPLSLFFSLVFGQAISSTFIVFLQFIIISYILFEDHYWLRLAIVAWNLGLGIFSYYAMIHWFKDGDQTIRFTYGSVVIFIGCCLGSSFTVLYYQKDIRKRNQELDQLLTALKEKNGELERFAFIASHDLKVPLGNIIGFGGLASKSIAEQDFQKAYEFLGIVNDNAKRMNHLIVNTLELVSHNHHFEKQDWVDLNEVFSRVHTYFKDITRNRDFEVILNKPLPMIWGRKAEILSFFKHIVGNGIQYNESAKAIIIIDYKELPDGSHQISFQDNGIGVEEKYFNDIFEMYRRLVNESQYPGTGLGLSISKKIIEKMGGKIWVESEAGNGSCFYVELPKFKRKMLNKPQEKASTALS